LSSERTSNHPFVTALAIVASLLAMTARADPASGTISYQSKAGSIVVEVKNVYLVKGPDEVSGRVIRRLVFSSADLNAKIKACAEMSCADGNLTEGLTVDFDAGPRINYWFVGNGQRVQYSGTAKPEAAQLAVDTPQRLVGKLSLDDGNVGGAKASIDFNATLLKEFTKVR